MLYRVTVTVPADHPANVAAVELEREFHFTDPSETADFAVKCIEAGYHTAQWNTVTWTADDAMAKIAKILANDQR